MIREGLLGGELPYLALGSGPPLVVLAGLSPTHENPRGLTRTFEMQTLKPFAEHFTVYEVNRKPGLATGTTMRDIADDYARALDKEFGEPVDAIGISTGGSVVLQLAIDHPDAIDRMVVAGAACKLGPIGKQAQLDVAVAAEAGRTRAAYRAMGAALFESGWAQQIGGTALWGLGPLLMGTGDTHDMIVTIYAEDQFDVTDELHRITAKTLVVAGDRDRFYSPELFRTTAEKIPDARLQLYKGKGHAGALSSKRFARDTLAFLGVH